MESPKASRRRLAELALTGAAFIWGATFVLVKAALADISVLLFLGLRFSLAAIVSGLLFRRQLRQSLMLRRVLLPGLLTGASVFLGFVFQTLGLRWTLASKSAFLTATAVVLVPWLDAVVYRTTLRLADWLGAWIAFCGVAVMSWQGPVGGIGWGEGLTLLAALCFAWQILLVGHFSAQVGPETLAFLQIVVAAIAALGTCWWLEAPKLRCTVAVVGALLVTAVLATSGAFTVQAWAQQFTTPARTAVILASEPVFAWLVAVLAGERVQASALVGAVLVLTGILVVELGGASRSSVH